MTVTPVVKEDTNRIGIGFSYSKILDPNSHMIIPIQGKNYIAPTILKSKRLAVMPAPNPKIVYVKELSPIFPEQPVKGVFKKNPNNNLRNPNDIAIAYDAVVLDEYIPITRQLPFYPGINITIHPFGSTKIGKYGSKNNIIAETQNIVANWSVDQSVKFKFGSHSSKYPALMRYIRSSEFEVSENIQPNYGVMEVILTRNQHQIREVNISRFDVVDVLEDIGLPLLSDQFILETYIECTPKLLTKEVITEPFEVNLISRNRLTHTNTLCGVKWNYSPGSNVDPVEVSLESLGKDQMTEPIFNSATKTVTFWCGYQERD